MINNCYNFKELKEKFGWDGGPNEIDRQIKYAARRGVEIEPSFKQGSTYFRIISNTNNLEGEIWKPYPQQPNLEVSNKGRVKNILTNSFLGNESSEGYVRFSYEGKSYQVHRMVLETFNPIANAERFVVDHVDGKKTNNTLDNLRWMSSEENLSASASNRQKINYLINELIQKYGYEKTTEGLLHLSGIMSL